MAQSRTCLATLDELPLPAVMLAPDGEILEVNDGYCAALKIADSKTVIGRSVFSFVDDETAAQMRRVFAALTPAAPSHIGHALKQEFDAGERRRIWQDTGIFDEEGRLTAIMAVFWDVTEEHRYNETLEELIRVTNDRSLDVDTILREILAIGYAYFDLPIAVLSRHTEEGVHLEVVISQIEIEGDDFIPHELAYCSITRETGGIVAIEDMDKTQYANTLFHRFRGLRSYLSNEIYIDGEFYGALSFAGPAPRSKPFSGEDVQLMRILVQWLTYALTRRRKVEALRASEEKYRFIYQNAPIMMHTVDSSFRITDVSDTWLKTLGYRREEVIGAHVTTFFVPASRQLMMAAAATVFEQPLQNAPRIMMRKDGTQVEVEASTLANPESTSASVLTVLVDVTDRNRAQRSLVRLNDGLRRTNEGLKRFNAIAAHDLQEPLRKIRLFGEVLDETLADIQDQEITEPLAVIRRSSNRLSKLVDDLLTFTRESQRGYQRLPIDLNRLAANAIEDLRSTPAGAPEKIELEPLPRVTGDPEPLQRMFKTLISNAQAYRRDGRDATMRLFAITLESGAVEIRLRDEAITLPEDVVKKIFEPFARLQAQAPSTGVGLAIAKSIAEGHGWTIEATSHAEGPGADFIVTIPAHDVIHPRVADHP